MAKYSRSEVAERAFKKVLQFLGCENTAELRYVCDLHGKMVFVLAFKEVDGEVPCTGYPLFYFVNPDNPDEIYSKSDCDGTIYRQVKAVLDKQQAAKAKAKH